MPEVKLPDAAITFDSVIYVIAMIVAAAGVLVAIVKGWEAYKKISVRDRVKKLETEMGKVKARLRLGDQRFALQSDDMGQILTTMQSLLIHFISGNDHNLLRENLEGLNTYMNNRATRQMQIEHEHEEEEQDV
jgi:hypothetical protein